MYAYVTLTHSRTLPAKLIRLWTGDRYTHVGVSFDSPLHLFSFGQKSKYNFLNGGFIEEYLNPCGTGDCELLILRIPVSSKSRRIALQMIGNFEQRKHHYRYNFSGILGFILHKKMNRKNAYFCSQFVSMLLAESGIWKCGRAHHFMRPMDFIMMERAEILFQGKLTELASADNIRFQLPSVDVLSV